MATRDVAEVVAHFACSGLLSDDWGLKTTGIGFVDQRWRRSRRIGWRRMAFLTSSSSVGVGRRGNCGNPSDGWLNTNPAGRITRPFAVTQEESWRKHSLLVCSTRPTTSPSYSFISGFVEQPCECIPSENSFDALGRIKIEPPSHHSCLVIRGSLCQKSSLILLSK